MQLICFQSFNKAPSGEPSRSVLTIHVDHGIKALTLSMIHPISRFEHIELPLQVVPTPYSTLNSMCVSAISRLPNILLEEEQQSYSLCQK